ncbi:hypothetical protein D7W79_04840 [Corallococcus exercitus]|nr:hypothetical protein D7W79_04840 [Corallococcus exercitus]
MQVFACWLQELVQAGVWVSGVSRSAWPCTESGGCREGGREDALQLLRQASYRSRQDGVRFDVSSVAQPDSSDSAAARRGMPRTRFMPGV